MTEQKFLQPKLSQDISQKQKSKLKKRKKELSKNKIRSNLYQKNFLKAKHKLNATDFVLKAKLLK